MLGIVGLAILVGLGTGGVALFSGYSILAALAAYMLSGWVFILMAMGVIYVVKTFKTPAPEDNHAYSG